MRKFERAGFWGRNARLTGDYNMVKDSTKSIAECRQKDFCLRVWKPMGIRGGGKVGKKQSAGRGGVSIGTSLTLVHENCWKEKKVGGADTLNA